MTDKTVEQHAEKYEETCMHTAYRQDVKEAYVAGYSAGFQAVKEKALEAVKNSEWSKTAICKAIEELKVEE